MIADLPAVIKVPGSIPLTSTSVEVNFSSIRNVQFSDMESSWCACGFCATIRMCNSPNVQVSSCAYSRMGKIPCASFRCASPRCAFLLAPVNQVII